MNRFLSALLAIAAVVIACYMFVDPCNAQCSGGQCAARQQMFSGQPMMMSGGYQHGGMIISRAAQPQQRVIVQRDNSAMQQQIQELRLQNQELQRQVNQLIAMRQQQQLGPNQGERVVNLNRGATAQQATLNRQIQW